MKVITVKPSYGKTTTWDADCGDCGAFAVRPYKDKEAAVRAANKHDREVHGGDAVVRIRQT
jgi:hypothetical protein